MTWTLTSAEARASEHESFKIPSREARELLCVGDLAKLIFIGSPDSNGERMWVEIDRVKDGRYRGCLRNRPVIIHDLEEGASIEFGPEHVADFAGPGLH